MGAKIKALLAGLKQQITDLWDKEKGLLVLIAIVAFIAKFRDIIISFLVASANRVFKNAQNKSDQLGQQEQQLNQQAEQLEQKAQQEAPTTTPVDDDWYKKDD